MTHNLTERLKLKRYYPYLKHHRVVETALIVIALAVSSAGCIPDMRIYVDRPPNNLQAIEQRLRLGQSTSDDVLALLGPPRGKGRAMLPIDPKKRDMWSYIYQEQSIQSGGESAEIKSLILFVYFEQNRYAGYFWFSSLPN